MTKQQLFDKYQIDQNATWEPSDGWFSVEIYREMNNGQLPTDTSHTSFKYVLDFLDNTKNGSWMGAFMQRQPKWGSFYLTAKRMVFKFADEILAEINR